MSSSLVVMGSCMYWLTQLEFRPRGQAEGDDATRKMTILMFGELHKQIEYGCTRRIPLCIGDFCFSGQKSARDAKWVHRYIVDVLLNDTRVQHKPKTLFFVENPKESYESGTSLARMREAYPTLESLLNPSMLSSNTAKSKNNAHKQRKLVNEIRDLLDIIERGGSDRNTSENRGSNFHPNACGMPSALTAIRSEVNECNRDDTSDAKCPVDTRRVIVDHFDSRMVTGPIQTIINPFPLMLRIFSFVNHMLGPCPPDGSDWVRSTASMDAQSKCLHYILGPASPLSRAEWDACALFVKERVVGDYLRSRYDTKNKRYNPTHDDMGDHQATEALKWLSEYGNPQRLVHLIDDMFRLTHSRLAEQRRKTERVFGAEFVGSFLRAYCHFCANVYTRPQIRSAFHALWITGLGKRVEQRRPSLTEDQMEAVYYGQDETKTEARLQPAAFGIRYPYFTREGQVKAAQIARLVNVKSSLTDSITDVTMLLRILESGGSKECDRAVIYGGMAHTKNVSRFFAFLAKGLRNLPSFCVAGRNENLAESCKCSYDDLRIIRERLILRESRGTSREYCYPEVGQYVVIEDAVRDQRTFFGESN